MSIFKMADLSYLGFQGSNYGFGSLKTLCTTSYRSAIVTIALNCCFLRKSHYFAFWRQTDEQTDRRTDGHHQCTSDSLIISEYCELVKLCYINCRGPVFLRHRVVLKKWGGCKCQSLQLATAWHFCRSARVCCSTTQSRVAPFNN